MKNSGDFSIGSQVWSGTSKLIEEMGELQQVLGKLLGSAGAVNHWDGSDLKERLKEELADVIAAIAFFQSQNFSDKDDIEIENRAEKKQRQFYEWHVENTVKNLK